MNSLAIASELAQMRNLFNQTGAKLDAAIAVASDPVELGYLHKSRELLHASLAQAEKVHESCHLMIKAVLEERDRLLEDIVSLEENQNGHQTTAADLCELFDWEEGDAVFLVSVMGDLGPAVILDLDGSGIERARRLLERLAAQVAGLGA